jgi:hypothetical protein
MSLSEVAAVVLVAVPKNDITSYATLRVNELMVEDKTPVSRGARRWRS